MPKRVIYLTPVRRAAVRRGTYDELREHYPRACRVATSTRCKTAKRRARRLATDHVRIYGVGYYPVRSAKRRVLRGRGGCCGGGCGM
jgi:hypothetical protein